MKTQNIIGTAKHIQFIAESISAAAERLAELEKTPREDRHYDYYQEVQSLKWEIQRQKLMMEPEYVCEYMYSDRHAYEVLRLETETRMVVRKLDATRADDNGMSESQSYTFKSNAKHPEITLRLHKNGSWYRAGGKGSHFGVTEEPYEYYDFSF